MQAILGAGSAVSKQLALSSSNYTKEIRLVCRKPEKVSETDQVIKADLSDYESLQHAVRGSEIVYITIGFEYKTSV